MATHDEATTVSSVHPTDACEKAEKEVRSMEQDRVTLEHEEIEEKLDGEGWPGVAAPNTEKKHSEPPTSHDEVEKAVEDEKLKAEEVPAAEEVKTENEDEEPKAEDQADLQVSKHEDTTREDMNEESLKGDEISFIEEKKCVEEEKPEGEEFPITEEVKAADEEDLPVVIEVNKPEEGKQCEELPVTEEIKIADEEEQPKDEDFPATEEVKMVDDEEKKGEELPAIDEVKKTDEEENPRCDELPVTEEVKKYEEEKSKYEELPPATLDEENPKAEEHQSIEAPSVEPEETIEIPAADDVKIQEEQQEIETVEKPLDEYIKDADVELPKTSEVLAPEPILEAIEEMNVKAEENDFEPAVVLEEEPSETEKLEKVTTETKPEKTEVLTGIVEHLVPQGETKHIETLQVDAGKTKSDEKEHETKVTGESSQERVEIFEANQLKINQGDKCDKITEPSEIHEKKTVSRDIEQVDENESENEAAIATKIEAEANEVVLVEKKVDEVPATATQATDEEAQKPKTQVKEDVILGKTKQSNIISKVKQTLVKAKKAIIGKYPPPKFETKGEVIPK